MILYIDPSVMTYAIQAIAGVIIALVAFFGIYYRKAKKKVSNKLGIDENRNKEVESDEIVVKTKDEKDNDKVEIDDVVVKKIKKDTPVKKDTKKTTANKKSTSKTTSKKTTNKTNKNKK